MKKISKNQNDNNFRRINNIIQSNFHINSGFNLKRNNSFSYSNKLPFEKENFIIIKEKNDFEKNNIHKDSLQIKIDAVDSFRNKINSEKTKQDLRRLSAIIHKSETNESGDHDKDVEITDSPKQISGSNEFLCDSIRSVNRSSIYTESKLSSFNSESNKSFSSFSFNHNKTKKKNNTSEKEIKEESKENGIVEPLVKDPITEIISQIYNDKKSFEKIEILIDKIETKENSKKLLEKASIAKTTVNENKSKKFRKNNDSLIPDKYTTPLKKSKLMKPLVMIINDKKENDKKENDKKENDKKENDKKENTNKSVQKSKKIFNDKNKNTIGNKRCSSESISKEIFGEKIINKSQFSLTNKSNILIFPKTTNSLNYNK